MSEAKQRLDQAEFYHQETRRKQALDEAAARVVELEMINGLVKSRNSRLKEDNAKLREACKEALECIQEWREAALLEGTGQIEHQLTKALYAPEPQP